MSISAAQVKELRDLTGAGMMDCKAALNETNGNMEEAVDWLRKKGISKADKKAGRTFPWQTTSRPWRWSRPATGRWRKAAPSGCPKSPSIETAERNDDRIAYRKDFIS